MNFKLISLGLFSLLMVLSCSSKDEGLAPEQLNQTGMNKQITKEYKAELEKLNTVYHDLIDRYKSCENCFDDEALNRQNQGVLSSIIESHESWEADLEKQDEVILNAYEGGTMASGVLNQNRVVQIKARMEFYDLLN